MSIDVYGIPIAVLAGRVKLQKFTTSGTYKQSDKLLYVWIRVVGGGGGGGTGAGVSGGGGGGGYAESWLLPGAIGNPVTVTVGSGGGTDTDGTASSFAALSGTLTGNGGAKGIAGNAAGGQGTGGDLNITGGTGAADPGIYGGSSQLGPGNGLYGGGGIGATAGSAGIVIIYEFLGA